MTVCTVCSQKADSNDQSVKCAVCELTYHMKCVNITSNDLKFLIESGSDWKCPTCLQGGRLLRSRSGSASAATGGSSSGSQRSHNQSSGDMIISSQLTAILSELNNIKAMQLSIISDISALRDSQERLRVDLTARCLCVEESVNKCHKLLSDHERVLDDHGTRLSDVEKNVLRIGDAVSDVSSGRASRTADGDGSASNSGVHCVDDLVLELSEREKRKKNLMVFGVPESLATTSADRKRADSEFIVGFISQLCGEVDLSQIGVYRVGTRIETKTRPIKINFKTEDSVQMIIRKANIIRSLPEYERLSVSFDRTPSQQRQYRLIRQQLDDRRKSGEQNLKIRYTAGVPRIVKGN